MEWSPGGVVLEYVGKPCAQVTSIHAAIARGNALPLSYFENADLFLGCGHWPQIQQTSAATNRFLRDASQPRPDRLAINGMMPAKPSDPVDSTDRRYSTGNGARKEERNRTIFRCSSLESCLYVLRASSPSPPCHKIAS